MNDIEPTATKRHRLRIALLARQAHDRAAKCVIHFIAERMQPSEGLHSVRNVHSRTGSPALEPAPHNGGSDESNS